jgi:hypothetical protein
MSDEPPIRAIGRDFGKTLPGFFWLNFFAPRLVEHIGRVRLLSTPGATRRSSTPAWRSNDRADLPGGPRQLHSRLKKLPASTSGEGCSSTSPIHPHWDRCPTGRFDRRYAPAPRTGCDPDASRSRRHRKAALRRRPPISCPARVTPRAVEDMPAGQKSCLSSSGGDCKALYTGSIPVGASTRDRSCSEIGQQSPDPPCRSRRGAGA